jgi:hypothetical protein
MMTNSNSELAVELPAFSKSEVDLIETLGKRKAEFGLQWREFSRKIKVIDDKEKELKTQRLRLEDSISAVHKNSEHIVTVDIWSVHDNYEISPDFKYDFVVAITDKSPKYHFPNDWRTNPSSRHVPQCLQGAMKSWGSEVTWERISDVQNKGKVRCLKCAPEESGLSRSQDFLQSSALDVSFRYTRMDVHETVYHAHCCGLLLQKSERERRFGRDSWFDIERIPFARIGMTQLQPCRNCHRRRCSSAIPSLGAPELQELQPYAADPEPSQPHAAVPQVGQPHSSICMPVSPSY